MELGPKLACESLKINEISSRALRNKTPIRIDIRMVIFSVWK